MKCYYEELAVGRDASDADIKSAYRKLALRWHPDKNLDCLEEAKERFQLIQQAYEVLSDPHERAWYDNHREQILRGRNSEYVENCMDVYQYFTSSCFKGFGDDEKGFYAVYSEVFTKLTLEDAEFLENEEELLSIPKFGNSQSSYEEIVGPFYAYWSAYSTKKSYEWLCPYDIREIKDRRILREVEKELKKITIKAKKERNEEIRNLVSFVRKRDRRVHAYRQLLEQRAEDNRVKQQKNRLEKIRKRQKELEESRENSNHLCVDEYEEQLKNLEQHYGIDDDGDDTDSQDSDNSNSEAGVYEDLYCIACNKSFKNEKAFANHELSKKHRENAEKLREEMQREESHFNGGTDNENSDSLLEQITSVKSCTDDDKSNAENTSEENARDTRTNKRNKIKTSTEGTEDTISLRVDVDSNEEDSFLNNVNITKPRNNKRNKKKKSMAKDNKPDDTFDATDNLDIQTTIKDSDDEDWINSSNKKINKKSKYKKNQSKTRENNSETSNTPTNTSLSADSLTKGKINIDTSKESSCTDQKITHICVKCKAAFQSKNKLFAHLKSTGHGVYIPKENLSTKQEFSQNRNSKMKHKK